MFSKEIQLGGTCDIRDVAGVVEQQFFHLIQEKFPDATITYEGTEFSTLNGNGITASTIPDFAITRKGRTTFVEITASNRNGKHPKARQIKIMENFPGVRYVVLTRENLDAIRKKHPEVDFFNARKIR